MCNMLKMILLLSCALFAQEMPSPVDSVSQNVDEVEVVNQRHLIYYDSGLFGFGKERKFQTRCQNLEGAYGNWVRIWGIKWLFAWVWICSVAAL